jgi:hypothetical protein
LQAFLQNATAAERGKQQKRSTKIMLTRKLRLACLTFGIAFGVMFGSAQICKATSFYYDNYYTGYLSYLNQYYSGGSSNSHLYYHAYGDYYYWLSCYYGDYYGYNNDAWGSKSKNYKGSTPLWYYYYDNQFGNGSYGWAYYGDFYWRQ